MDKASRATEKAAVELGQASREIERAALKFQTDMDKTLPEVAAASKEFQELVRSRVRVRIRVRVRMRLRVKARVEELACTRRMCLLNALYFAWISAPT